MSGSVSFSIVIPTFNRPTFLRDAILSAANAAPAASEIIVVNDGDPLVDADLPTVNIPLRVIQNEGPRGAAGARNYGVHAATGDWIFFLDDDDLAASWYWKYVASAIISDLQPDVIAFGFCATTPFTDRAQAINQSVHAPHQIKFSAPQGPNALCGLGEGFWVSRHAFFAAGGLDTDLRVNEDTDFCINLLSRNARVYKTTPPGVLIFDGTYGTNQTSVTQSASAADRRDYFERIINKYDSYVESAPAISVWLHRRLFKFSARANPQHARPTSALINSLPRRAKLRLYAEFAVHRYIAQRSQKHKKGSS